MAALILLTINWPFLDVIAGWSQKYAREDPVREVPREGYKKPRLSRVPSGQSTDGSRKRFKATSKKKWLGITAASIMVYFGLQMAAAAMGLRKAELMWYVFSLALSQRTRCTADIPLSRHHVRNTTYGPGEPWARNAMTIDAFRQHGRFVLFCDKAQQKSYGKAGFSRLYPVQYLLDHFGKMWKANWTMGEHIAVDESMILYKGKKLDYVQYMPAKVLAVNGTSTVG
jgi:hypothetical protein